MSASVYYNEIDPYCCQWLQNLMDAGHLSYGWIDSRPIQEVHPDELEAFTQCHFFAGIGGWPLALRMVGWGDEPVWTGSCPCQPFSVAGKRKGTADERHLWPFFANLIGERMPPVIFGEQVASKDGRIWLTGVRTDLEKVGYAIGAADLCAASVSAPHIRQRLYWVANSQRRPTERQRFNLARTQRNTQEKTQERQWIWNDVGTSKSISELAISNGRQQGNGDIQRSREYGQQPENGGIMWMDDTADSRRTRERQRESANATRDNTRLQESSRRSTFDFWSEFELIPCLDGKTRRIEPGTFPLAHGVPARMGKLRAYGNAIVPQLAAEFIQAYLDCPHEV